MCTMILQFIDYNDKLFYDTNYTFCTNEKYNTTEGSIPFNVLHFFNQRFKIQELGLIRCQARNSSLLTGFLKFFCSLRLFSFHSKFCGNTSEQGLAQRCVMKKPNKLKFRIGVGFWYTCCDLLKMLKF